MNVTPSKTEALVKVEGITKEFSGKRVLDSLSFELKQGEVLGFLGPNGAGKTTAMRIVTGYFPPNHGKVLLRGRDLSQYPKEVKSKIGYLPEVVHLYGDMKVREFIDFSAAIKGLRGRKKKTDVEAKLASCGLWDMREKLIKRLSKGYRQRVGLAQALIGDPDLLVLDEPTSGLDPRQIIEIRNLIREIGRNRTVILSTHILPEVNMVCDRVLIINQGRVVASGTTDELAKGLRESQEILVTMGNPSRKEGIIATLEAIPLVLQIQIFKEEEKYLCLSLTVAPGEDLRPVLSRLFVERDIPLLEIRAGQLSLEEVFMQLVLDEKKPRARL